MSALATPGIPVTPPSDNPKPGSIAGLITHLSRGDNHLYQALTSLQAQTNAVVNNTTAWTTWTPQFADDYQPLASDSVVGYYMTSGNILYLELNANIDILDSSNWIQFPLPVDVGQNIVKTCAGYLVSDRSNGLTSVQMIAQLGFVFFDTLFAGVYSSLYLGGAIGII